ncbi:huntingtin-interacting protein 1 isoform X1 [Frankliniella occidentalis]|uniref:Huntingtin-interacting protein 1 isoform X1 n=1 Tax=Frankliniella occidentalis TaxID=133901 RepID=A0A6J1RSN6_FRAOC|nr:huntingtin-interacting protein 1 isoform X1 [Frankliniella occidentalis]
MASISLPRVLQPRKSSLELERENFEKFQHVSISKAINAIECPVKEKHVRSAIIGTFQEKSSRTFWESVNRLPLEGNRIVAWKFCHVLHKILREGYESVVPQSQRYKDKIRNIGKLWGHLKESYGKLIQQYTQLLIVKLDFHRRNPRFPGNLAVSQEDLDSIGENNVNNYFEMAVEMFDYMDEILALQSAIFGSLDMSRSNSMTSCGQCRLAPLIPCIQDSSQLYDYCVKILFKLHSELPADTLQGHRERFSKQFKDLKQFYLSANTLQYFRNLIVIPPLPEKAPNFLIQSEFLGYVTPVVRLPTDLEQSEADASEFNDASDAGSPSGSLSGDLVDLSVPQLAPAAPSDEWIQRIELLQQEHFQRMDKLQQEHIHKVEQLQQENNKLRQDHHVIVDRLHNRLADLETALATKDSELLQEKQLHEDLMRQTTVADKTEEAEKRAKAFEDKFLRLKEVYSKLREEHIQLLRQKADVDKQITGIQKANEEAEKRKLEVEAQLTELVADRDKVLVLTKELEKSQIELQKAQLITQEQHNALKNILVACISEAEVIVEKSVHEVDNPAISALSCTPDYFETLVVPLRDSIVALPTMVPHSVETVIGNWSYFEKLIRHVIQMAHLSAAYTLQAKATSNTSPDIELGEHMAEKCKDFGGSILSLLRCVKDEEGSQVVKQLADSAVEKMDELGSLLERLTGQIKGDSVEIVGDMVETELANMDKAIEEAASRIAEILSKSRTRDSGLKLEVNEKILDTCTALMLAIRILVQKARLLQAEIVAKGKGTASAKEFYKRNHQWTEGLISAAKAVAMGAKFLLTAADKVVSGEGKLESLIVASQEIAASTAQLVVASRVKASRDSANLTALSQASRGVTQATGQVVATAKDCAQLIEDNEELDVSGLTLHQAKRLEMDCQVKVLELEASLQQERQRLAALRRQHYQLAGDVEGWEIMDKP